MFFSKIRKETLQLIGAVEKISLPELGVKNLLVRVDTGAAVSALHAENIRYKKKDGRRFVHFDIVIGAKDSFSYVPAVAEVKQVKLFVSSNGLKTRRPVIETKIKLGRKSWKARVSLIDRSSMEYRMLLGRSALRRKFVVDVSRKLILK